MRFISIIFFLSVLTSCATLLNKQTKTVIIQLDEAKSILVNQVDTISKNKEFKYKTLRKNEPLSIEILDSNNNSKLEYNIYPKLSATVGSNFFLAYSFFSFIDFNQNKGFTYPNYININTQDTTYIKKKRIIVYEIGRFPRIQTVIKKYKTYPRIYPKDLFLKFGTTLFSSYSSYDLLGNQSTYFSTLDLSAGIDYYYNSKNCISINLFQSNFALNSTNQNTTLSTYASNSYINSIRPFITNSSLVYTTASIFNIQHKHQIHKFLIGYGGAISYNRHTRTINYNFFPADFTKSNSVYYNDNRIAIGPIISTYYLLGKGWNIGLCYKPILFNLNYSEKSDLENFFAFEMVYRFKLSKRQKFVSKLIDNKN